MDDPHFPVVPPSSHGLLSGGKLRGPRPSYSELDKARMSEHYVVAKTPAELHDLADESAQGQLKESWDQLTDFLEEQ